jgi:hypothetical protein
VQGMPYGQYPSTCGNCPTPTSFTRFERNDRVWTSPTATRRSTSHISQSLL